MSDFSPIHTFKNFLAMKPQDFKNIDYQRFLRLAKNIIFDKKILLLSTLFLALVYFIDYDFIFKPVTENLNRQSEEYQSKQNELKTKESEDDHFKNLARQVKELPVHIIDLQPGEASKVAALGESQKVIDMVKNIGGPNFSELPEPYKYLKFQNIELLDDTQFILVEKNKNNPPVALSRFVYKLKIDGTYAALAMFVNQLVLLPELLVIDQIEITKVDPSTLKPLDKGMATGGNLQWQDKVKEPDAAQEPDYPVPLHMDMTLSIFLRTNSTAL